MVMCRGSKGRRVVMGLISQVLVLHNLILTFSLCFDIFRWTKNLPSPVGEPGMIEMTQALELIDVCYEQVGAIFNQ